MADLVRVRLFLDQESLCFEVANNELPRLERRQAVVRQTRHVHPSVEVHAVDDLEVVALADLVVHRVVAGRDLERPGAEVLLHCIVGDDGQLPSHQRQDRGLADDRLVAGVGRVHRDARVGEHRLGPDGRDHHLAAAFNRVADEVQRVVVLFPFHFEVGYGRLVVRAPVDDARRAVDPSAVVEGDECGHHRPHIALVHREAEARPVQRSTEDAVLPHDRVADLGVPLVDASLERLAAKLLLGLALGGKLLLDDVLGRDGGMVHARQEENLKAGHAPVSGADVLQRVIERMAHVQLSRDVRRRKADGVFRLGAIRIGREQAGLLPAHVPSGLGGLMVVRLRHVGHGFAHRRVWSTGWRLRAPAAGRLARLCRRGYVYALGSAHGGQILAGAYRLFI